MRIMEPSKILTKLKKLFANLLKLDFSNPAVFLTAIALCIIPFILKYLVLTGLLIGLCLAISIILLVQRSPLWLKKLINKYPLVSDLTLSTVAVAGIGSYLGSGLTLGLGFIFCDIILSLTLHSITDYGNGNEDGAEQNPVYA